MKWVRRLFTLKDKQNGGERQPSSPCAQPWRGRGTACVWRGEAALALFLCPRSSPADTNVCMCPGYELGTNEQMWVTLRVAFLNLFSLSQQISNPSRGLSFPPQFSSRGCSQLLISFPTLSLSKQNFQITVSVLVLSEKKEPTFVLTKDHKLKIL